MDTVTGIFLLLGGIGLFLFGINYMSAGLEKAAGKKLKSILEKMTKNGFLSVLVGILVTVLIQSSGATSVMVVSFVEAGLMELSRALYVMLGANIGTTITAQIIAFKIETIAPVILFVGVVLYLFIKNRTCKKIGSVVLGFGLLFVGIYLMGTAVNSLEIGSIIAKFLSNFNNPFLGLLFGIVITSVIQSSSASIGILQVLVMQMTGSDITLSSLVFIIMGMNIGAIAPVVILSFSGDRKSKQCALSGVFAKVAGVIVFSVILLIFPQITSFIEGISPDNLARQIANFHLLFNVITTVLIFPFVNPICKFAAKILPISQTDIFYAKQLNYITPEATVIPTIGVEQCRREVIRMAKITLNSIKLACESVFEKDMEKAEKVLEAEEIINYLNHSIQGYLVQINGQSLDEKDSESVSMMLHVTSDIERVGDHAENIAEYAVNIVNDNVAFNDEAIEQLQNMAEHSIKCFEQSIEVYEKEQFDRLDEISDLEEQVDDLQDKYSESHIIRLKNGMCHPVAGVIFTDMVTDLERCSDHAINIAFAIKGENNTVTIKKAYIVTRGNSD